LLNTLQIYSAIAQKYTSKAYKMASNVNFPWTNQ